ncbi:thermonuclease family protein [Pontivivens ytuae]|nr:thermonuclease family protein [Pontivivens ytuae]
MTGTTLEVQVERVVDGDTVRVFLPGAERGESVRILSLDTEEVSAGTKPVTELGRRASERAKELMEPGDTIRLILPGNDPLETALQRYRGNFGRLLCYVELADGTDFQEVMIREGFSPYFQKYGYAHFAGRHAAYVAAERAAQSGKLGIWDQIANNGSEMRNYAALTVWWDLRARIIEGYREIKRRMPEANLFNSRLDHAKLVEIAKAGGETTVFMELRDFSPTNDGDHIIFRTGSRAQPFSVFVPEANMGEGQEVMNLLLTRYVSESEMRPARSYAYVTGSLKLFPPETGDPEITVTRVDQVTDWPSASIERGISTLTGPVADA